MVEAALVMLGVGTFCGLALSVASRIFHVDEDPRIEEVADSFAGANCGGCGFAGCSAAAVAVVEGHALANICVVGGLESAHNVSEIMGIPIGVAEPLTSLNPCNGGDRALNKFIYQGVNIPGVEIILRMRQNMLQMKKQFDTILEDLVRQMKDTYPEFFENK